MALTESDKAALNTTFQKLLQVGGLPNGMQDSLIEIIGDEAAASGGAATGDIVVNPTFATQAAITYYVDTAGSDSNDGSISSPFLTIQKAIDLLPKQINNGVVINISVGTFTGANITGFHFKPGGYIALVGTMSAVALTGLMSGTAASATAGSNTSGTWSTMTVTGAGWTVDELRGKHVRITGGTGSGQVRAIASNTATVLTLPGAWTVTPNATSTFEIVEPATVLNGATAFVGDYLGNGTSASGRVKMAGNVGGGQAGSEFYAIFLDTLKTTGSQFLMNYSGESIAFVRCSIGNGVNIFDGVSVLAADNSLPVAVGGNPFYNLGGRLQANRNVIVFSNNTGVAFTANMHVDFYISASTFLLQSNYVYQGRAAIQVGPLSFVKARGDKYFGNSLASAYAVNLTASTDTQTPTSAVVVDLDAVDISGWAVAGIRAAGPVHVRLVGVVSGTTNGTAINIAKGASIQVSSTTTLTGTIEVNLDGASQTLATMRALTPKIIIDANYGTKFYE